MQIENVTVYDADLINEGARGLTKRYKVLVIVCILILAMIPMYYIIKYGLPAASRIMLITFAGILVVAVVGIVRIKSYRKMIFQRLQVINHTDKLAFRYLIDEEKILVETDNKSNILFNKDIKRIVKTKNIYVIIYLGNLFILISRNGFNENDENVFRKVINV